ncbi:MAG: PilW family protein [Brevinematia bacterium]
MKKNKNKGLSLLETLIYSVLLSIIVIFLVQILIYQQKASKTLDVIANFQNSLQTAINILDFHFTNAGYTATQEGTVLSSLYYVDENNQVVNNQIANQINQIRLLNNNDRDEISFFYFELEENRLGFISSARNLGGGNAAEIDVLDGNLSNQVDTNNNGTPDIREIWPDPNVNNDNDPTNGVYPVIMYSQDPNTGRWVGVVFYITRVQYQANHMQHRPLTLYGGNLNKDIVNRLPQTNNVRIMKPRNIFRGEIGVDQNDQLFIETYNFRTDRPFNRLIILSNVESFNIRVGLDLNNDNQTDLDQNNNIRWYDSIPAGEESKVTMVEYTIVVRSTHRNLLGLDRNPLTGVGGDRFKRFLIRRTVTLKNIVNPEI